MKKKVTYISLLVAVVFLSCNKKKPLPQEEVTEPVFYVSCNVQGKALKLEAGANDYYMNSSYYQDSANVYVYKGDLKQTNCSNGCGYSLTFLIRSQQASTAGGPMNVNDALRPGPYLLSDEIIAGTQQTVSFAPLHANGGETYKWTFMESNTTDAPAESYSVTKTLQVGKTYSVALYYEDPSGTCSTTHTNVFKAGSPLQTSVKCAKNGSNPDILAYAFATLNATGSGSYSYEWNFGDGATDYGSNPIHTYASEGTYITELKLTDNNTQATCRSYYQCNAAKTTPPCQANFKASFLPVINTIRPYTVSIFLTDPSGNVYSTKDLGVQPQSTNFEIVSVDDYQQNENGQPTKRLKIKFNCVVQSGNSAVNINNGEAVIAVAYK
jgi:hypothetical protein